MLRQALAVAVLSLKGIRYRTLPSFVIVAGMACVVGVLLSILSVTEGLSASRTAAGDSERVIVLSAGAQTESGSSLSRDAANTIRNASGIKSTSIGPMIDSEIVVVAPVVLKSGNMASSIVLHGVGSQGLALHPEVKIISGRMFRPGRRELIAGVSAHERFSNISVGENVLLPDGDWLIVGIFTANRDVLEGGMIGDVMTLMPSIRRKAFNSVLVQLKSADQFQVFKSTLTSDPSLTASVERQSDYYARTSDASTEFFRAIAYAVTFIMAIGALFATLNIMYGAVSARKVELATLRALGFGKLSVAFSVLLETSLLCLVGGLLGAVSSWLIYDGTLSSYGVDVFRLVVSVRMAGIAILLAVGVGLVGALAPSVYASSRPLAAALRGN